MIEIPAAFLLISPFVSMRKIGAWLQILLQVLIILTGSYNFFNLLTIALCMPCMIGEESSADERKAKQLSVGHRLQVLACATFLAWACKEMFVLENGQNAVGLRLTTSSQDCDVLLEWAIPLALVATLVFAAVTGVRGIAKKNANRFTVAVHTLVCCACISIAAVPFLSLSNTHQPTFWGVRWDINRSKTWNTFRRHSSRVSHGYGLFRRMTGVGHQQHQSDEPVGWAGLPPSIVARPEIILEARIDDSEEWRELDFRWKPGRVDKRPRQAAPHQPRFDWRMWFAALGTVQRNPWLVSFVHKILLGCPAVLDLLDEPELAAGTQRITSVRANLHEYDFTRLGTKWARRIPGAHIVNASSDQVWSRKLVGQYFPPLEVGNQSLLDFLTHAGYDPSGCSTTEDRCKGGGSLKRQLCRVAVNIQEWDPLVLPMLALTTCCVLEFLRSRSNHMKLKSD